MISQTLRDDFAQLSIDPNLLQMVQGKRIYVTGASGQIGWYLVRLIAQACAQGTVQCQLFAHVRSAAKLQAKFSDHAQLACQFVLNDDAAAALREQSFDLVIHCASKASPKFFADTPVDVMLPNGILTHALLEGMRHHSPQGLFVYLSTTGVTGFIPDHERPSREQDFGPLSSIDLSNCYLESKRFGEMLTLAYARQYGIRTRIVRPSITFGPGFELDDGRSYADFVGALLAQQPIKLTSDGSAIRNFLYISDFIRGLATAITHADDGSVLNIASPYPTSILALATLLNEHALPHSLGPVDHAPPQAASLTRVNFKSTDASVEALRNLGWWPTVSLLDGFQKTIRHYQEVLP